MKKRLLGILAGTALAVGILAGPAAAVPPEDNVATQNCGGFLHAFSATESGGLHFGQRKAEGDKPGQVVKEEIALACGAIFP